ncbi:unnamed protein product [Adineta steineri]|uniref:Uncharacterized protein n=1 Tax=Adineta steineri TaxID=433720 RepID=A0A818PG64_9BILA|nr:unnamed protein product [Adineta steineri]CAF1290914.1 unnamed protein product [Adineta steineri]CAF3622907.1 unnamed protein product [Adineta steineri]CAF3651638.1 unnamed protein product [Adineta steineri]
MPWSLLSPKRNINHLDLFSDSIQKSEKNTNEKYKCQELSIPKSNSLLTSLNRVCFYWKQIIYNRIRSILTLVLVSILNTWARLTYFTRQTTFDRSTPSLPWMAILSSIRAFEVSK